MNEVIWSPILRQESATVKIQDHPHDNPPHCFVCCSECWPMTKRVEIRVSVIETEILRWRFGIKLLDRIPNDTFKTIMLVASICETLQKIRLGWHVIRRDESHLTGQIMELVVEKRKRKAMAEVSGEGQREFKGSECLSDTCTNQVEKVPGPRVQMKMRGREKRCREWHGKGSNVGTSKPHSGTIARKEKYNLPMSGPIFLMICRNGVSVRLCVCVCMWECVGSNGRGRIFLKLTLIFEQQEYFRKNNVYVGNIGWNALPGEKTMRSSGSGNKKCAHFQ